MPKNKAPSDKDKMVSEKPLSTKEQDEVDTLYKFLENALNERKWLQQVIKTDFRQEKNRPDLLEYQNDCKRRLIRFDRAILNSKDEIFAVLEKIETSQHRHVDIALARIAEFGELLGTNAANRKKAWSKHLNALSAIGLGSQPAIRGNRLFEAYAIALSAAWSFTQNDELTIRELATLPRADRPTENRDDWGRRFHAALNIALDEERDGFGDESGPAYLATATIANLFEVHRKTLKTWLKDRDIHSSRYKTGR
ncbi:MAG: hypothetical protein JXA30_11515 [Deltaproteobacteria bacterium]|nr:hypothetical protein [Deltaproteobacteria bacterium]